MRSILVFLSFLTICGCSSLQSTAILSGNDFTLGLDYDGAKDSEGIKRSLHSETGDKEKWQFFYFCDGKKNKDKCGKWVDEKGVKIKGKTPKVTKTKEGANVLKMTVNDSGSYTRVPENKDLNQAYLERVDVNVIAPPPPPPKTY